MSSTLFSTSKTHPLQSRAPNTGFELKSEKCIEINPGDMEVVVECKQIEKAESAARNHRTAFGIIGNLALDSNQFPSIERSCDAVITTENQQIKVPSDLNLDRVSASATTGDAREWKREKTFDGCPVFCVIFMTIKSIILFDYIFNSALNIQINVSAFCFS